jgi:capsule polysaccharide export protein KpsE/RkpR
VRSTEARISELREQIQKMAGQSGTQASDSTAASDNPYPSVRQLPILGVGYADRYRRLRVDETVFATLTTEFELAKVQEAKEIPTVKVLDPPNVPEKKAFPPRLIIISFGTIFAVILGAVWIVGVASWNEVDPNDPRKAFVSEVFQKLGARYPWMSSGDTSSDGSDISSGNGSAQR